jgi:hypothetical protein
VWLSESRWDHLWKPVSDWTNPVDWTSSVPPPDKSGGALWSLVQTLWKSVDSPDMSGLDSLEADGFIGQVR